MSALQKAIDLVKKATEADNAEKYEEALPLYQHAIDYFLHGLKYEAQSERAKSEFRERLARYLNRAEELKKHLSKKSKVHSHGSGSTAAKNGEGGRSRQGGARDSSSDGGDPERDSWLKQLDGAIVADKPNVHWDDIAGLAVAKESLKETVILPVKFPHLFTGKRKPLRGTLLYGPPGSGKSSLAKAVATAANLTLFSLSAPELVSKWLNGSDRLVRRLFERAREKKPALVFLHQLDLMCGAGSDTDKGTAQKFKMEFVSEMQSGGANDGVHVIGATSRPWGVDPVIRKTLEKRIYTPLPDRADRRRTFEIHIGNKSTNLYSSDLNELSIKTDGYSGADISSVVREALMMPLRKVQSATHFKTVKGPSPFDQNTIVDDLLTPCSPRDPGAREMSWMEVDGDKLLEPPVTHMDFLRSVQNTPATVKAEDLKRYEEFTADFGQLG